MHLEEHPDGTKRVTMNGVTVIFGMAMDEYHRTAKTGEVQYFSKSRLQSILQTDRGPEWVYHNLLEHPGGAMEDEGDRDVGDSKEAHMKVGRAIDCRLFDGEEEFNRLYTIAPPEYPSPLSAAECKRRMLVPGTDEAMEMKPWHPNATYCREWASQQEELGREVLTESQMKWLDRAIQSLSRHARVWAIMEDVNWVSQVTFRWKCPLTGRHLQARPDLVNFADCRWADLKTTRYWLSEAYGREYFNRGYHLQSFLIDYALSAFCGKAVTGREHIICGKQPWPQVKVVDLAPIHIEAGRDYLIRCHAEFERCETTGEWWEVQKDPETLFVPNFIQAMHTRREDMAKTEFYDYGSVQGMGS